MRGYLLPHPPVLLHEIGRGREFKARDTLAAYDRVKREVSEYQPTLTLLITPHGPLFSDGLAIYADPVLQGDFAAFGAPELKGQYQTDSELIYSIIRQLQEEMSVPVVYYDQEAATTYGQTSKLDHGALVPLMMTGIKSKVIVMNFGLLSYVELYKVGTVLHKALSKTERLLIIASGDLSHKLKSEGPYHYDARGPAFDEQLIDYLTNGKVKEIVGLQEEEVEPAGECGLRSLQILLGMFDGHQVKTEVLSYEGPFGVGYGIVGFQEEGLSPSLIGVLEDEEQHIQDKRKANESEPVRLARQVIEHAVKKGKLSARVGSYMDIPSLKEERKGAFVSIKDPRGLRGCIGTFLPTQQNVYEEIVHSAISAALEDPRFPEIRPEELKGLRISVDILEAPEKISSIDDLDPRRYGVIVSKGGKRGLLLPNLTGVDTAEEQVRIAKQKAGISFEEEVSLERFEVTRYE